MKNNNQLTKEKSNICPLCNSDDVKVFDSPCYHTVNWIAHVSSNEGIQTEFTLLECAICSLQFKSNFLKQEVFEDSYLNSEHRDRSVSHETALARRFDLFEKLAKKFGVGNRVLDFGCGPGDMLYSWSDTWSKHGVELSSAGQQVATQRGIDIVSGDSLASNKSQFGAITLIDLIEHIHNPRRLIGELASSLESNGSLIIYTGRTSSWFWRMAKGGYWYCSFPEHVCFFSEKTFEYIAQEFNLRLSLSQTFSHMNNNSKMSYSVQLIKNLGFHLMKKLGIDTKLPRLQRGYPSFTCAKDHLLVVLQKK